MAKKKAETVQDADAWAEREEELIENFTIELDGLFAELYPVDGASLSEQKAAFGVIASKADSILRDKVGARFLDVARQNCLK